MDLGPSFRVTLLSWTRAATVLGATAVDASKVLTLSTLGAVRVSPTADLTLIPARLASISTDSFGSRKVQPLSRRKP